MTPESDYRDNEYNNTRQVVEFDEGPRVKRTQYELERYEEELAAWKRSKAYEI